MRAARADNASDSRAVASEMPIRCCWVAPARCREARLALAPNGALASKVETVFQLS